MRTWGGKKISLFTWDRYICIRVGDQKEGDVSSGTDMTPGDAYKLAGLLIKMADRLERELPIRRKHNKEWRARR